MLAAWMIFPHFVVSSATNFPNSRGCHRFWNAPYVAKLCLHPPIAKARIDCAVELIDDSDKGVLWGDHPVPHYRLVARHKLGDGWHVLQCRGTRIAGHGHGLQLTRPDLLDNCRNGAKHYLQPSGKHVGQVTLAICTTVILIPVIDMKSSPARWTELPLAGVATLISLGRAFA